MKNNRGITVIILIACVSAGIWAYRKNHRASDRIDVGAMMMPVKNLTEEELALAKTTRLAAEAGDAEAQWRMGELYSLGKVDATPRTIAENQAQVRRWYLRSANQGNWAGQLALANLYRNTYDREKSRSPEKAAQAAAHAYFWSRLAADNHDWPELQHGVGDMLKEGVGVEPNPVEAYAWYRIREKMGMPMSDYMKEVAKPFTPEQHREAEAMAEELFKTHNKRMAAKP